MSLFTRSLWPATVVAPYRRLAVALVAAPLIVAAVLTMVAFLIAGMSEPTREAVILVTWQSAQALAALTFMFTLTFGLAGIAILWSLARRGLMAWLLMGAAAGALAGMVTAAGFMARLDPVFLVAFAVGGCVIFALVRRIAGVRAEPDER